MTQSSPTIGSNKSGLAYRQEDNDGKKALLNHHKGPSAPIYAEAGTIWLDDAATPWILKLHDGSDWIALGSVNASTNAFQPYQGTGALRFANYASDTGSADAYAVAPVPAVSAYAAGLVVTLKPGNANTGASTVNVSSLGAKAIKMFDGSALQANAMVATGVYLLAYDGTDFIIVNPSIAGNFMLARGSAVASASTTDIGDADSDFVEISGTTTIVSLGTTATRNHVWVKFQGVLTLTHNASSLILPGGANITTAAGDVAEFARISGGNWQCLGYHPASGKAVAALSGADMPSGTVIQSLAAAYATNTDLTGTIPNDDTIPQNTEGTEITTQAITPTSASSIIEIEAVWHASGSGSTLITGAIFVDSVANALAAGTCGGGTASIPTTGKVIHREGAGSTVSRTYKLRVGSHTGTIRLNGTTSARLMGGVMKTWLIVREIKG